jgi:hypothetical protein
MAALVFPKCLVRLIIGYISFGMAVHRTTEPSPHLLVGAKGQITGLYQFRFPYWSGNLKCFAYDVSHDLLLCLKSSILRQFHKLHKI